MTPEQFRPLIERAIGRNPAAWEIDRVYRQLATFDVDTVQAVLAEFRDPPRTTELVAAVRWREERHAAREKALNPTRCEHGHRDLPYDACPQCNVGRAERAHRGASKARQALRQPDGTSDRDDIATPVEATAGGAG